MSNAWDWDVYQRGVTWTSRSGTTANKAVSHASVGPCATCSKEILVVQFLSWLWDIDEMVALDPEPITDLWQIVGDNDLSPVVGTMYRRHSCEDFLGKVKHMKQSLTELAKGGDE